MTDDRREHDIREAMHFLAQQDVCAGGDLSGPPGKAHRLYRRVTEHTLDGLKEGLRGRELRRYVRHNSVGLDPTTWLLIIRIIIEVVPLLVAWWQNRT